MNEPLTCPLTLNEGQAIGEAKGKRSRIPQIGGMRFGEPSAGTLAIFEAIIDTEELKILIARLHEVESWGELLGDV